MTSLLSDKESMLADMRIISRQLNGLLSNPIVLKNSEAYFFLEDVAMRMKEEFKYLEEISKYD